MSDSNFVQQLANEINGHLADTVATEPRFVKLGYGDGTGRIVKDAARRIVYIFEGTLGDLQNGVGAAYLPAGKGLELRDGKAQEGIDVEIRKSAGRDTWEIAEVRRESLSGTDGRMPSEQRVDQAAWTTMDRLDVLRPQAADGLSFKAPGAFPYIQPSTGARRIAHDPTGSVATQVAALTSGQHQAAMIYFDTGSGAFGVATATAVTAGGALPSRNEFYDFTFANITIPSDAIPVANVYLYYGQTTLVDIDFYRKYDPRMLFVATRDTWATLTTSNATTTTIVSIPIAELSAVTITGDYVASIDDYSATSGGTFRYTVRRANGGNVTQVAAATISQDGTAAIGLDVDTGTQTLRIRATGILSENWNWRVRYTVTKV